MRTERMIDLESIRRRARQTLVLVGRSGHEDVYLWEHSVRVLDTALKLAALPEYREPMDQTTLSVAALFHEAGWVVDLSDGKLDGKVRKAATPCPKCGRNVASRFTKCMYCGQPMSQQPFV